MTPERWQQIESLFHDARSKRRGAATRGFPQRVRETKHCGAKSSRCCVIRRDSRERACSAAARLVGMKAPGQHEGRTFGPYLLGSLVGAGGMGEVYRAHDSRLGRDVAVKVLSDSIQHDPARTMHFEREARALAALNHPHVAAIYGMEESDGTRARNGVGRGTDAGGASHGGSRPSP